MEIDNLLDRAFASCKERKEKCLHVYEENHPRTKEKEEYSEASKEESIFVIDPLTGLDAIFRQMLSIFRTYKSIVSMQEKLTSVRRKERVMKKQ